MLYQKGALFLLLARSALSFTTFTPQQNHAAVISAPAAPLCLRNFGMSRPKSCNILFSEVSDEIASDQTVEEEASAVEITSDEEDVEAVADETDADETDAAVEEETEEPAAEEAAPEAASEGFKIYCGNLSYEYGQDEIEQLFAAYGTVTEISVPLDKMTGRPRGFAFVTMDSRENGEAAIDALHGSEVGGRTIRVNEQLSKEELDNRPKRVRKDSVEGTKIYVGNLPFDTEDHELISMFSQHGEVKECYQPTDRNTGRPRGFAFITMSEEEAEAAIDTLHQADFGGRQMIVNKSVPKGESPRGQKRVKLYVGNLSFNTEEDEVLSLFSEYGDVIDCYVPRDRDSGRSRGFAFVTMGEDAAINAENECNGLEMDGRVIRVNQAQPKGRGGGQGGGYGDNYGDNDMVGNDGGYYDNGSGSWGDDGGYSDGS